MQNQKVCQQTHVHSFLGSQRYSAHWLDAQGNDDQFCSILDLLLHQIRERRLELSRTGVIFLHDNVQERSAHAMFNRTIFPPSTKIARIGTVRLCSHSSTAGLSWYSLVQKQWRAGKSNSGFEVRAHHSTRMGLKNLYLNKKIVKISMSGTTWKNKDMFHKPTVIFC